MLPWVLLLLPCGPCDTGALRAEGAETRQRVGLIGFPGSGNWLNVSSVEPCWAQRFLLAGPSILSASCA